MNALHSKIEAFNEELKKLGEPADGLKLVFKLPISSAVLQNLEQRIGTPLPTVFRALLTEFGSVASESYGDVWNTLQLGRDLLDESWPARPLAYIDMVWGGRPEIAEELSSTEIQTIESRFVIIGSRYVDDNVHVYFLIDEEDNAHALWLDQDDMDSALNWLKIAASENLPRGESIDQLIYTQLKEILSDVEDEL